VKQYKVKKAQLLETRKVPEERRKMSENAKFVFSTRWIVIFVPGDTAFVFAPEHFNLRRPYSSSSASSFNLHPSYSSSPHKYDKMDPQTQADLSKLNEADKKELNMVLANEAQKSNIQQSKWPRSIAEARISGDEAASTCIGVY
jgi:import inner membrane translocase subunit TIM8